ncbi:MAG TPA: RNA polymerase subunit sigma-70 [Gammaproteobacteria bacterium]|nr:RNA polymerase subunit sigma-70 [Gammaproteobacteria bacterium]
MTRIPRGATQFKWRRQRQEKARRWPSLNLVALMDVFTILVFFFLVHSADGAPEAHNKLVHLPESVAEQQPRDTPIVMITLDNILVQGEPVAVIDTAMHAARGEIKALRTALQAQLVPDAPAMTDREVTIMGDKTIPFELLNRVMQTCKQAGYGSISLSVLQRSAGAV